jgi:poly(beta-D-mannuronate) lyase
MMKSLVLRARRKFKEMRRAQRCNAKWRKSQDLVYMKICRFAAIFDDRVVQRHAIKEFMRRKQTCNVWACVLTAVAMCVAGAHAENLRSPWDATTVTMTDVAYSCPLPPVFAKTLEIGSYYTDVHMSVIDPVKQAAFQAASDAPTKLAQSVSKAADAYRADGSRAAAICVYSLLDSAAKAGAWSGEMPTFQGTYVQNWTLSAVAISYLKVRQSGLGTKSQDAVIRRWFGSMSAQVRAYFDAGAANPRSDAWNNHIYWAGLAVAAAGIADSDGIAFRWGLDTYKRGVDSIQPDGSLLAEMYRAQMALHYHLYALGPLILLAELGEANGLHAYEEDDGAIHRLVRFCVAGLEKPAIFEKRVGVKQVFSQPYEGEDIGWAVPYARRFPNASLEAMLRKAPWVRYTTWGGEPPP